MSKPETPCLPGCKKTFSQSSNGGMTIGTDHAANCQNASDSDRKCPACGGGEPGTLCRVQAPKAEAPQERRIAEGRLNKALTSALNGLAEYDPRDDNHWAKTAVAFARGCVRLGDVGAMRRGLKAEAPPAMNCDCGHAKVLHRGSPVKCLPRCGCTIDWGLTPQDMQRILGTPLSAPPAPVSEPPIDPLQTLDAQLWAKEFMRIWSGRWAEVDEGLMIAWFANAIMRGFDEASNRTRAAAERDALKAQLDTDREVLKATENNISNLAKFAASPITPNYNLPMSGLAIAIRDSLAAALGREILLTQEWDAMKAQNATLTAEVERLRENVGVKYGATGMCQDRHPMVMFPSAGGWGENCPMCAARAAREAGKVR